MRYNFLIDPVWKSLNRIALFIMVSSAEGSFSIKLLASIVEIIAPFEVSSNAKLSRLSIEIVLSFHQRLLSNSCCISCMHFISFKAGFWRRKIKMQIPTEVLWKWFWWQVIWWQLSRIGHQRLPQPNAYLKSQMQSLHIKSSSSCGRVSSFRVVDNVVTSVLD